MSKNRRQYIGARIAKLVEDRRHGATLVEVPALIAAYTSSDPEVRADALKRSCPCHVPWDVYEQLRKPALRLRRDPSPAVRALAMHLEEDARTLAIFEAAIERYADRDDQNDQRPSRKRPKRSRERARRRR